MTEVETTYIVRHSLGESREYETTDKARDHIEDMRKYGGHDFKIFERKTKFLQKVY